MNKRIITILIFAFSGLIVFSQQINIKSVTIVETNINTNSCYPVLNFEGNKMLFSTDGYNDLYLKDFVAGTNLKISDLKGSGYQPIFSNDGKRVFFHAINYENNRRYESVESYNLQNSRKQQVLTPRRDVNHMQAYNNGFIVFADKLFVKVTFGKASSLLPIYASPRENKIAIFNNNKTWKISPFESSETNYIWVSVSPNGKKILFTATGKGTYICDLKGKILAEFGLLNAPVWYNDNFIAGMYDKDDGHKVISSEIVLISVDGKNKYPISGKGEIAMYPTTSSFSGKIAWQTNEGKIKIAEIEIK